MLNMGLLSNGKREKFVFTFNVFQLRPWPLPQEQASKLAVGWQRGKRRGNIPAVAPKRSSKHYAVYHFDDNIEVEATLTKSTTTPTGYEKKFLLLALLEVDDGGSPTRCHGTVVINLADFARETSGPKRLAFKVAVSRQIKRGLQQIGKAEPPTLIITVKTQLNGQQGPGSSNSSSTSHSSRGSRLTADLGSFFRPLIGRKRRDAASGLTSEQRKDLEGFESARGNAVLDREDNEPEDAQQAKVWDKSGAEADGDTAGGASGAMYDSDGFLKDSEDESTGQPPRPERSPRGQPAVMRRNGAAETSSPAEPVSRHNARALATNVAGTTVARAATGNTGYIANWLEGADARGAGMSGANDSSSFQVTMSTEVPGSGMHFDGESSALLEPSRSEVGRLAGSLSEVPEDVAEVHRGLRSSGHDARGVSHAVRDFRTVLAKTRSATASEVTHSERAAPADDASSATNPMFRECMEAQRPSQPDIDKTNSINPNYSPRFEFERSSGGYVKVRDTQALPPQPPPSENKSGSRWRKSLQGELMPGSAVAAAAEEASELQKELGQVKAENDALRQELLLSGVLESAVYLRGVAAGGGTGHQAGHNHAPARRLLRGITGLPEAAARAALPSVVAALRATALFSWYEDMPLAACWWSNLLQLRLYLYQMQGNPDAARGSLWLLDVLMPKLLEIEAELFERAAHVLWDAIMKPVLERAPARKAEKGDQPEGAIARWIAALDAANDRLVSAARQVGGFAGGFVTRMREALIRRIDLLFFKSLLSREPTAPMHVWAEDGSPVPQQLLPFVRRRTVSFQTGMQLKLAIMHLSHWAHDHDVRDDGPQGSANLYPYLRSCADALMMRKELLLELDTRQSVCAALSLPALVRLLDSFEPDEFSNVPMDPNVLEQLRNAARLEGHSPDDAIVVYRAPDMTEILTSCDTGVPARGMRRRNLSLTEREMQVGADSDCDLDELARMFGSSGTRFDMVHDLWKSTNDRRE